MQEIHNVNGTSGKTCKCGSWLDHWKNYSGESAPIYCPVAECVEEELVGAHVQKNSLADESWYIVPLCRTHNAAKGKSLTIAEYKLVTANVSLTCG